MKSYVYLISLRLIVVFEPRLEQAASTLPWQRGCDPPLPPPRMIVVLAPQLELGNTKNEITHLFEIIRLSDFAAADCRFGASAQTGCVRSAVTLRKSKKYWAATRSRMRRWRDLGAIMLCLDRGGAVCKDGVVTTTTLSLLD